MFESRADIWLDPADINKIDAAANIRLKVNQGARNRQKRRAPYDVVGNINVAVWPVLATGDGSHYADQLHAAFARARAPISDRLQCIVENGHGQKMTSGCSPAGPGLATVTVLVTPGFDSETVTGPGPPTILMWHWALGEGIVSEYGPLLSTPY